MKPRRYKCRQEGCRNYYDEVVGGEGWGAKPGRGKGDCIPCWMAATIRDTPGGTIGKLANFPEMRSQMERVLARGGWTWQDLEAAYNRVPPPRVM